MHIYDKKMNWFNSIKKLVQENKYSIALTEIEEYLEIYPDDDFGKFLHARILEDAGYVNKAERIYEFLATSMSNNRFSAKLQLARIHYRRGDNTKAENLLQEIIKDSVYNEERAQYFYANIKFEQGYLDEAIQLINGIEGEDNKKYIRLARIYAAKKDKLNLEKSLEKIKEEELTADLLFDLFLIKKQTENYEEALLLAEKIKGMVTDKSQTYYKILSEEIHIYHLLRDNDSVINLSQKIINSGVKNISKFYLISLARAYQNKGDYFAAKEYFEEALNSDMETDYLEGIYRLGCLEQTMHHFDEAKKYLLSKELKEPAKFVRLIQIAIKENNYQEAEKYLEDLKKIKEADKNEIEVLQLMIDKHWNRNISVDRDYTYRELQIINYSKKRAIEHIQKEHVNNPNQNKTNFHKNINIEELFEDIKTYLTEDNLCFGDIFDIYEIDYPNIGENIHKCCVVTVPNTKDIITMYPENNTRGYRNRVKDYEIVIAKKNEEKEKIKAKKYAKFY